MNDITANKMISTMFAILIVVIADAISLLVSLEPILAATMKNTIIVNPKNKFAYDIFWYVIR